MKQFEPRVRTIGEYTFYVRPFPAFVATNISGELAGIITPLLGNLAPLISKVNPGEGGNGLLDVNVEEAAPAIAGAFSSVSGDKLESLMKKLLVRYKNISVELPTANDAQILTEDMVNEIFCGDVQGMFILAFEVIRSNYNGFFEKLGSQFGSLSELLNKVTPSTKNTGSST